tara:strand:- start:5303 stop:5674 length:372 start_codon:yes stop_codon:yes gene_type:complete
MDLDYSNYLQFFFALIFVLGLIGAVALLLRHFGFGGAVRLQRRLTGGCRRLEVTDVLAVDARRRLVLVRRDNTEHLILLGANEDLLIESCISAPEMPKEMEGQRQSIKSKEASVESLVTTPKG